MCETLMCEKANMRKGICPCECAIFLFARTHAQKFLRLHLCMEQKAFFVQSCSSKSSPTPSVEKKHTLFAPNAIVTYSKPNREMHKPTNKYEIKLTETKFD